MLSPAWRWRFCFPSPRCTYSMKKKIFFWIDGWTDVEVGWARGRRRGKGVKLRARKEGHAICYGELIYFSRSLVLFFLSQNLEEGRWKKFFLYHFPPLSLRFFEKCLCVLLLFLLHFSQFFFSEEGGLYGKEKGRKKRDLFISFGFFFPLPFSIICDGPRLRHFCFFLGGVLHFLSSGEKERKNGREKQDRMKREKKRKEKWGRRKSASIILLVRSVSQSVRLLSIKLKQIKTKRNKWDSTQNFF